MMLDEPSIVRVLVCGGRDYNDYYQLMSVMDTVHKMVNIGFLGHGAARGADSLADTWAATRLIPRMAYKAECGRYGDAAGPIRNRRMFKDFQPHYAVAFPGGTGTADMISILKEAGVSTLIVEPRGV